MNILLAEDDADDRGFFFDALEKLPVTTNLNVVTDGEGLMQRLHDVTTKLPDVLFLDLNMPRKDGMECLLEIKENEKLKSIPVIIFSTSMSKETINLVFKMGASVYVHKPGDFKQLMQVIHHAIQIASENIFSPSPIKYILNA